MFDLEAFALCQARSKQIMLNVFYTLFLQALVIRALSHDRRDVLTKLGLQLFECRLGVLDRVV